MLKLKLIHYSERGTWRSALCLLNSSSPRVAYMRQWIGSVYMQIMACRLFGTKSLSKPMLGYYQLGTNFSEILVTRTTFSFKKNAFENVVCEMAAILPRERWVNHHASRIHNTDSIHWQWTYLESHWFILMEKRPSRRFRVKSKVLQNRIFCICVTKWSKD